MTPQQLRNSILQQAIEGKLVDQRPEEGTAEKLYAQIQEEKQKLIAEGKLKKEKPLPEITEDEIPFDIPESWKWVRFGDLSLRIQYGYNAPALQKGDVKFVRISDIQDNLINWDSVPYCEASEDDILQYKLEENDILFARTGGTVGKSYLVQEVPELSIFAGYLIRSQYGNELEPKFIKFFMESSLYWEQLHNGVIATAQPNCNGKTLSKMILPLPPLAEQKRIVAKIEELLPFVDKYEKAYNALEEYNSRFPEDMRKSILQQAIEGKLVDQRPDEGTAEELYAQIQEEKKKLIAEGKIKKEKPLPEIAEDEIPFDIPESWKWVRLSHLYNFVDYRGKTPHKTPNGIFLITASNIKAGFTEYTRKEYISEEEYKNRLSRGITKKGDLLFTTEAPLGNIAICDLDICSCGQRVITFQKNKLELQNNLFMYFILSTFFQKQLIDNCTGTTAKGIKAEKLKQLIIPLPPLEEQKRIVAKIEELLPYCDKLK